MEQKSYEESSEKQPAISQSKQVSKKQVSGDGASGRQPAESQSKSERTDEAKKKEHDTEIPTTPSDKRQLEAKEQKFAFSAVGASQVPVSHSPTKRRCTERYVVASEKIEPGKKELKADEPKPGTSAAGNLMQGSPKRSPTMPGTSAPGFLMQGSPKRSPTIPGTPASGFLMQGSPKRSPTLPGTSASGIPKQGSPNRSPTMSGTSSSDLVLQGSPKGSPTIPGASAAGVIMQGSPKRSPVTPGTSFGVTMQGSPKCSPTKRTYKERHQSVDVDELVEKRLKEESGYQSDSALDLRKDFKKQMSLSTSPEQSCKPTSSDKIRVEEKQFEEKYATQSNFQPNSKIASSEVTSSDSGKADERSASTVMSSSEVSSSAQVRQVQNVAEENKNKTSPRTSQHSGARPKEAASGSRSVEYIEVSYPRYSPSKLFYGEPTIRRISPQSTASCSSGSGEGFKVPAPPPPPEPSDKPFVIRNALDILFWLIEDVHAVVSAEQVREQVRKENEERIRKEKEKAENLAKAKLQAAETTKKLREKEARLKEAENKSKSVENKSEIVPDETVAEPSTSRDGTTMRGSEGKIEAEASAVKLAVPPSQEEHKITEHVTEGEKSSAAHQSMRDENANIMEGGPSRSACKDNANKSDLCSIQSDSERTMDDAKPSTSGTSTERRPQETLGNQEHFSLQQLVPQINEISLNDSLENIAIADSEQEDDSDDNDDL